MVISLGVIVGAKVPALTSLQFVAPSADHSHTKVGVPVPEPAVGVALKTATLLELQSGADCTTTEDNVGSGLTVQEYSVKFETVQPLFGQFLLILILLLLPVAVNEGIV